jgi:hypothetical protein
VELPAVVEMKRPEARPCLFACVHGRACSAAGRLLFAGAGGSAHIRTPLDITDQPRGVSVPTCGQSSGSAQRAALEKAGKAKLKAGRRRRLRGRIKGVLRATCHMPSACCRRYRYRSVRAWFEFVLVWLVVWLSVVYVCVCLLLFAGRWGVRSACVGEVEFVGDTQACV